jgi:hypothetical protein
MRRRHPLAERDDMSDRELLEMAAKAAGVDVHESTDGTLQQRPILAVTHYVMGQPYSEYEWNPMRDDAQAFRLAVKLGIQIDPRGPETRAFGPVGERIDEYHNPDPYAATRRAIVRAAAEIGKAMP